MGTCLKSKYGDDTNKLRRFYRSDRWHKARNIVIARANGLCERCGKVGVEVHHKIHLTIDNVDDLAISTNPDNLILLCTECHNKEHGRFISKTDYKFNEKGDLISR